MSSAGKRKCRHCGKVYRADARNVKRQRHCSRMACQQARKRKSQRRWLNKPENRDYFSGPEHAERVRAWRATHPKYWRRGVEMKTALQDDCPAQPLENTAESGNFTTTALQDVLASQPLVLIGLIAQFTGGTLQDDIAQAARRLVRLGQDIVRGSPNETSTTPGAAAARAAALQLDRSTPGP